VQLQSPCRSELARDALEYAAGHQAPRVINSLASQLLRRFAAAFECRVRLQSPCRSELARDALEYAAGHQAHRVINSLASQLLRRFAAGFECRARVQSPCRSELARDALEYAAGHQAPRVIIDDHREQARSQRLYDDYLFRRSPHPANPLTYLLTLSPLCFYKDACCTTTYNNCSTKKSKNKEW
jgi:hypothetical protein